MLQEAEFSMTEGAFLADQQGQNARYAGDSKLFVQFHVLPVLNISESDKEGRPIFRDVVHVRIMQPGNKDSIIDRPITDEDKGRFRDLLAKWEAGERELIEGTILESVARDPMLQITLSQIEELRFFNIRTLEQLAGVADVNAQKFMGLNELRKRARDYLENAKEHAVTTRLQSELESRDNQIATQKLAIEELQAKVESLLQAQPPKRGPGRPRKDAA